MVNSKEKQIETVGIIPARFYSSRFEGKVLVDIGGKPMVQHVWERAKQSKLLDDLIVACDDERVRFSRQLQFGT